MVLAIDDNQVIGHVAVYLRDVYLDSFPETIGILSCVVVAHKYRGKGVAASLIKRAHAILKEHSVNFLFYLLFLMLIISPLDIFR
ncbi:GNAT family N-acetyltransferase [Proteus mirabilis]